MREELLNVLILCFLRSKNIFEFDQYSVLEALLRGLDDQKERNRFIALEAIVAFASIGNKIGTREIIYQLAEKHISELVIERLEAAPDMNPYLGEVGVLELPYLEHIEQATTHMQHTRRDGLNSEPIQGNSVRKHQGVIAPSSATSLQEAAHLGANVKRTASANNRNQDFIVQE